MKKKRNYIWTLAMLACAWSAASPIRVIRTIETREPADAAMDLLHGETIDLRVRVLNYAAPVDLRGWSVVLHGVTNGQSEAESYQYPGAAGLPGDPDAAAQGWVSVALPVSAWWPRDAAAGRWAVVASNGAVRILRVGGPLTVIGVAAADALAAPPVSGGAGAGLEQLVGTSNVLASAIAAEADARIAGDLVAMTNWQSVVFGLTYNVPATYSTRAATLGSTTNWIAEDNGVFYQYSTTPDTNRVLIISASPNFNGPSVGTVYTWDDDKWTSGSDYVIPDFTFSVGNILYLLHAKYPIEGENREWFKQDGAIWEYITMPQTLLPADVIAVGSCVIDFLPVTNRVPVASTSDIDAATNALIQTYLLGTNAWMTISNATLSIWRTTNGIPSALWSSAESEGGGDIDPSFTNAIWSALGDVQAQMASKADKAWGQYAPDGSANPDTDYMTYLNSPAVMHASGFQWATYGAYSVLAQSGAVAFNSGSDGEARWGLDLHTNYVGFVRGGSVLVGAAADSITVAGGIAEIVYPFTGGDWPTLWFSPSLDVPFAVQTGIVWVDNLDDTATVTAPANTEAGFWYATTTAEIDVIFEVRPPARLVGGIIGATNNLPVVYDSTITVSSGGKTYRLPAQEVE